MGYPIVLQLKDKLCVIVGAGRVAQRRVSGLLEAGAKVCVVGVEATSQLQQLALAGKIELWLKTFAPADLGGAFLAMATTDDPVVNHAVQGAAEKKGILFCGADHQTRSDFQVPAVARRGALQLAISTGGHSPAYAKLLKGELETWIDEEHIEFLDLLADLRPRVLAQFSDAPKRRQEFWQKLVTSDTLDLARKGKWDAIKERIDSCLLL